MFDDSGSIVALVAAVLIAYAVILWLGTIVWTYRDIRERTRDSWSQTVAVLLVLLFNIPGLVRYLILRPRDTLAEVYERRLEAEALLRDLPETRSCPTCLRAVREDYLLCPFCRTKLREVCSGCGRTLDLLWSACPYCGAQGPQPIVTPTAPLSAEPPAPAGQQYGTPGPGERAPASPEAGASAPAATHPTPPSPQ
jgi:RNA polymerase subunit RPABC4/transcription elongation factor Spt4